MYLKSIEVQGFKSFAINWFLNLIKVLQALSGRTARKK